MTFVIPPQMISFSHRFHAPAGKRIYAIGDIHGRADLLKKIQTMIIQDSVSGRQAENVAIYMGDYIDRGPFVRDALDHVLKGLPYDFRIFWLLGNHEQVLLDFLQDSSKLPAWLEVGGLWTLMGYGVYPGMAQLTPRRCEQLREELIASMPDEHLSLLRFLSLHVRLGDYLFVHAGIDPNKPLETQSSDDLLWMRELSHSDDIDLEFMVVHGHTVERQPCIQPCRLGIDTGAYATGVLTCAVFEENRIRFLNTAVNQ